MDFSNLWFYFVELLNKKGDVISTSPDIVHKKSYLKNQFLFLYNKIQKKIMDCAIKNMNKFPTYS
jgi:hypothetical protein